jgi:NAD(P)-dependent dehydrogenase (short-subunit alcohol dehydrogenase family)
VEVAGRVAVVTGGAAGLGLVIARRLAAEGGLVVLADVDDRAGSAAVSSMDSSVAFVRADARVGSDVERMIAFAVERFGGLDVLVNNAGGWGAANFPAATPLDWGATLDLNLRAPMLATQLALEPMRSRGGGAVVNVASTAGLGLAPYASPEYGAAKAGLIRFTASVAGLRDEMGVRINCVVPDWIGLDRAHAELAAMSPAERASAPPFVDPDDVAETVLWLARDDSLAGRVVVMRGGESRRLLGKGTEES